MNITELIEQAENVHIGADGHAWMSEPEYIGARSRTLLPLLVAVIKNQQRQIDAMRPLIEEVHELDSGEQDCIAKSCGDALIAVNMLAAELEDVKP